jgi:hypothetical protein
VRDVRMIQRREHLGFAMESRKPIRVPREKRRQRLDGDVARELRIPRAIHLAHPTAADERHDFVRTEPDAGWYRQARDILTGQPGSRFGVRRSRLVRGSRFGVWFAVEVNTRTTLAGAAERRRGSRRR